MRLFLAFCLVLVTGPLAAEALDPAEDIPPQEWREMVVGHSVTYNIGGAFWAHEAYDPASNAVVIRMADGTCLEGTWSWSEGEYCFAWRGEGTSCFRHVRRDGEILIIPMVDGLPSGQVQTVAGVTDLPVSCGSGLAS